MNEIEKKNEKRLIMKFLFRKKKYSQEFKSSNMKI
jgi:hypothetical protein